MVEGIIEERIVCLLPRSLIYTSLGCKIHPSLHSLITKALMSASIAQTRAFPILVT